MVYGRYNELVNGGYKPTNITGGHHPVQLWSFISYNHVHLLYHQYHLTHTNVRLPTLMAKLTDIFGVLIMYNQLIN